MQDTHKQEATETIVGNNCHQVVDGGDQGTGSYSRVHMNLLEKQRDAGSHRPGNDHGQHQGKADTAGHRVSKTEGLALEKRDVKTDDQEGKDSQNHTVGETDPHFLPYQLQLLFAGEERMAF